jgi:hypothetical protein
VFDRSPEAYAAKSGIVPPRDSCKGRVSNPPLRGYAAFALIAALRFWLILSRKAVVESHF